ncbi:hypothetical protein K8R14_03350 [bacterium]|nr:hypothetical protein [bacterium]
MAPHYSEFDQSSPKDLLLQRHGKAVESLGEICAMESLVSEQIAEALEENDLLSLDFVSSGSRVYPVSLAVMLLDGSEKELVNNNPSVDELELLEKIMQLPSTKSMYKGFLGRIHENERSVLFESKDCRWKGDAFRIVPIIGESIPRERAEEILSVISSSEGEIINWRVGGE